MKFETTEEEDIITIATAKLEELSAQYPVHVDQKEVSAAIKASIAKIKKNPSWDTKIHNSFQNGRKEEQLMVDLKTGLTNEEVDILTNIYGTNTLTPLSAGTRAAFTNTFTGNLDFKKEIYQAFDDYSEFLNPTEVYRNSEWVTISKLQILPGDIIILRPGAPIHADIRVLHAQDFRVDNSSITGEAQPQIKSGEDDKRESMGSITEAKNIIFYDSNVTQGWALGVVFRTGENTLIGQISTKMADHSGVQGDKITKALKTIFYDYDIIPHECGAALLKRLREPISTQPFEAVIFLPSFFVQEEKVKYDRTKDEFVNDFKSIDWIKDNDMGVLNCIASFFCDSLETDLLDLKNQMDITIITNDKNVQEISKGLGINFKTSDECSDFFDELQTRSYAHEIEPIIIGGFGSELKFLYRYKSVFIGSKHINLAKPCNFVCTGEKFPRLFQVRLLFTKPEDMDIPTNTKDILTKRSPEKLRKKSCAIQ